MFGGQGRGCDVACGGMSEWHVLKLLCVCVCWLCGVCAAVVSLRDNRIGDQGAAAIGAGLHGMSSMTSLKYVIQAWVMCAMERGQVEGCDGECCGSWCGAVLPVSVCDVREKRCGAWCQGWCVVGGARMRLGWCMVWACGGVCGHMWWCVDMCGQMCM